MPEIDTTIPPMDDAELFNAAMAPEPKVETAPVPPPPAETPPMSEPTGERPRDDQGRFVPVKEAQAPEPVPEPVTPQPPIPPQPDPPEATIPPGRLRELREERDAIAKQAEQDRYQSYALQQELKQLRDEMAALKAPPQQPVDFFTDPDAAIAQRLDPFTKRLQEFEGRMKLQASRAQAMAVYGPQKVTEMESAIGQAIQNHHPDMQLLAHNMQASDDPVGVAMHWFNLNRVVTETGGDLNAYLEKMADDPTYQAKVMERARAKAQGTPVVTGTRPAINLPPSLSSAPNTGMPNVVAGEADMSDKALFAHAMAPEPRRR